jgi:SAM-dependent methyltransferase
MWRKLLPGRLKDLWRAEFQHQLWDQLPSVLPHFGFFPHQPQARCYCVPNTPEKAEFHELSPLPVPPKRLWAGYGETAGEYLSSGKEDVQSMTAVLGALGTTLESSGCILELGCAGGRMIRWLADVTTHGEVWGTDISASAILWCQQYLSPPFRFVTTTTWPHLPFEDRYFGLIYAGSVFTHIDDLADAWFLELRRVLRPGGKLYITIHDRNTVALLNGKARDTYLSKLLHATPEYEEYIRSDFGMFTIYRSVQSQVFYDIGFLRRKLEQYYRILAIVEQTYGYQSAVLLDRV